MTTRAIQTRRILGIEVAKVEGEVINGHSDDRSDDRKAHSQKVFCVFSKLECRGPRPSTHAPTIATDRCGNNFFSSLTTRHAGKRAMTSALCFAMLWSSLALFASAQPPWKEVDTVLPEPSELWKNKYATVSSHTCLRRRLRDLSRANVGAYAPT